MFARTIYSAEEKTSKNNQSGSLSQLIVLFFQNLMTCYSIKYR